MSVNRKTILLKQDFNTAVEWDAFVNVPFLVDEMIVRSVSYYNDGTEAGIGYVTTNLINDDALCLITDQKEVILPTTTFTMNQKTIKGTYHFVARAFSGATNAGTGKFMILLEFIGRGQS